MPAGSQKDTPEHKLLKEKARAMGLKFGPRLAFDKLTKLVEDFENGIVQTPVEKPKQILPEAPVYEQPYAAPVAEGPRNIPNTVTGKTYMSSKEYRNKQVKENKRNAGRLVRCRITCMNPHKKNWTGEIISVGSARLGTFKKFIPYNTDEPYHIPWIIYQHMKERQCRIGTTQRLPNGQEVNRSKLINEYAIEVLTPLTGQELKDLAQRQAMAAGTV